MQYGTKCDHCPHGCHPIDPRTLHSLTLAALGCQHIEPGCTFSVSAEDWADYMASLPLVASSSDIDISTITLQQATTSHPVSTDAAIQGKHPGWIQGSHYVLHRIPSSVRDKKKWRGKSISRRTTESRPPKKNIGLMKMLCSVAVSTDVTMEG